MICLKKCCDQDVRETISYKRVQTSVDIWTWRLPRIVTQVGKVFLREDVVVPKAALDARFAFSEVKEVAWRGFVFMICQYNGRLAMQPIHSRTFTHQLEEDTLGISMRTQGDGIELTRVGSRYIGSFLVGLAARLLGLVILDGLFPDGVLNRSKSSTCTAWANGVFLKGFEGIFFVMNTPSTSAMGRFRFLSSRARSLYPRRIVIFSSNPSFSR